MLIVEKVATEQDEIDTPLICDLQAFFERVERILAGDLIIFFVAHMVVRRYQDLECVTFVHFFAQFLNYLFLITKVS